MKIKCRKGVYSKYTLKDRLMGSTAFWICMGIIATIVGTAVISAILKLP